MLIPGSRLHRARTAVHLRRRLTAGLTAACFAVPIALVAHSPLHVQAAALSMTSEVSADAMPMVNSAPVTTTAAGDVLVAFLPAGAGFDAPTGGALAWNYVGRDTCGGANGVAVYWALAAAIITNQVFTSQAASYYGTNASITIATFKGAGTVTPIGATNFAACTAGSGTAPSSAVTTSHNNGWVWAAGDDNNVAQPRTIGPAQTMVSDYQDSAAGNDYWVQHRTATTPASGTVVTSNDTAPINGAWALASVEIDPPSPYTAAPTLDVAVTNSNINPEATVMTSGPISTAQTNQVLIAFITGGDQFNASAKAVTVVTGGGLQWTRVAFQGNTNLADVWYAVAFAPVTNVQVTSVGAGNAVPGSITVTAWSGIDTESPIGAVASTNAATGAPTVSLTTTRPGSWVWGEGVDTGSATPHTVGGSQTMDHQALDTLDGKSNWVQHQTAATGIGTVPISDSAPTAEAWALTAVEIMPALVPVPTLIQTGDAGPTLDTLTTAPFSTASTDELLVAFVAVGKGIGSGNGFPYETVTGAGLTWTRVAFNEATTNNGGLADIWWAIAPATLTNVTVTDTRETPSTNPGMLTVQGFTGEDLLNPIGAVAQNDNNTGVPTLSLTTTRNNAWVWGVGTDWNGAVARAVGANQTVVDQKLDATKANTFWVQQQNAATGTPGTVIINDTAPTTDDWELSTAEILPPLASAAVTPDIHVNVSTSTAITTHTSAPITTTLPNEVLVLSVATDSTVNATDPVIAGGVSGGGLTWTKSAGVAAQINSAEVWWALAATAVSNLSVTVTTTNPDMSPLLELTSWAGADTRNPIGATATGSGATGVPTKAITTTRANSVVWGVGADDSNSTPHVPASGQIMRYELLGNNGSDGWVQHPVSRSAGSGTVVTISDGSLADSWNLAVVEIMPAILSIDFTVTSQSSLAVSLPSFNTTANNTLLVAFVSHHTTAAAQTTVLTSTAGLIWTMRKRTNTKPGVAEIWSAPVAAATSNIVVTDTQGLYADTGAVITVEGFTGSALPTIGTNFGSSSGTSTADSVGVTTLGAQSLVWGVGTDQTTAAVRTPGATQAVVDQRLNPSGGTFWVQNWTAPAGPGLITLNDTCAGCTVGDVWNYTSVEIRGDGISAPIAALHISRTFATDNKVTVQSPAFTTTRPDELVVAAISAKNGVATGATVSGLATFTGPSLTWTRAIRSNTQKGDAEVWSAIVPQPTPNLSFLATESPGVGPTLISVTGFLGADLTSPIGATAATNGSSSAPTVSVTTTQANSWAWGAGNDWTASTARSGIGAGNTLVANVAFVTVGTDTGWTQSNTPLAAISGASLTLSDAAVGADVWNYAAVEIKAGSLASAVAGAPTTTANPTSNGSVTLSDTVATGGSGGTPTGTVTFHDGDPSGLPGAATGISTSLGTTAALSAGSGSLAVALAPGAHTITAVYSGDGTYNSTVSPVLIQQVYRWTSSTVQAWGKDSAGFSALGDGGGTDALSPVQVSTVSGITQLASAADFTLAVDSGGHVWGWGAGNVGQLGQGNTSNQNTPVEICDVGTSTPCAGHPLSNIVGVATNDGESYAVATDGSFYAWGQGTSGSLCNGATGNQTAPVHIVSVAGVVAVAARHAQAFALTSSGAVYGCGDNTTAELGLGYADTGMHNTPTQLTVLGPASQLAAGTADGFALLTNNTAMGWGQNARGDLGDGSIIERDVPYQTTSTTVVQIVAGNAWAVARLNAGTAQAAGAGTSGQMGNSASADSTVFTAVSSISGLASLAAGDGNVIAQKTDNSIWAWGAGANGALGNNATADINAAVAVHGPGNVGTLNPPFLTVATAGMNTAFAIAPLAPAQSLAFTIDTTAFALTMDPSLPSLADQTQTINITVLTNANSGYTLTVADNATGLQGGLVGSPTIPPVSATMATAVTWPGPPANTTGYTVTGTGVGDPGFAVNGVFAAGTKYAGYRSAGDIVAQSTTATGATPNAIAITDQTAVDYATQAGTFTDTITFTVTPNYA